MNRHVLLAITLCLALPAVVLADRLVAHASPHQPIVTLLGDKTKERTVSRQAPGQARATPFRALRSGTTTAAKLFIARGDHASVVHLAVYGSSRGRPGALLTSGTKRRPAARAWNTVDLHKTRLVAGHVYWIALLGSGGTLAYESRANGRCLSRSEDRSKLGALPRHWSSGGSSDACPISAYVVGHASAVPTPAPSQPAPTTTTPAPTTPTPPSSYPGTQKNCASQPSACGYPDATNSGVAPTTPLTGSGSITANVAGEVIKNVNIVNGSITVTANNVTIENSKITTGNGTVTNGTGDAAIVIQSGVSGTVVQYTTMQGSDCNGGSLLFGVMNNSNDQLTMDHDYGQCIDDILHGAGTLSNSYSIDNANIPNDHYEPVAYDGGGGGLTIDHDTLLNPHDQTAAVFTQCTFGDVSTLTITNSLLAGGGYTVYGPTSDPCGSGTGPESVTNNRFSRIYFRNSGQYGTNAYFPKNTTWSGNIWDDTLATAHM